MLSNWVIEVLFGQVLSFPLLRYNPILFQMAFIIVITIRHVFARFLAAAVLFDILVLLARVVKRLSCFCSPCDPRYIYRCVFFRFQINEGLYSSHHKLRNKRKKRVLHILVFFEDSHALSHRFPEFYRPIGLDILGEDFYYPGQLFHYSALVYHLWRLRNHRCPITVHQFLILAIYIFSLVFDSNHLKIFVPSV